MADEPSLSVPNEEIILFAGKNDQVLVWSAEDVHTLRTKYRIVGSLIGSLPRKAKQNVYLSLPLLLSKNETTLLLQKKFARLVKNEADLTLPSQNETEGFNIARGESISGQIKQFKEENKKKEKVIPDFIEAGRGRKKKRGRKRRREKNDGNLQPSKIAKIEDECKILLDNKVVLPDKTDIETSGNNSLKNTESQDGTVEKDSDMDINEQNKVRNVSIAEKSIENDLMKDGDLEIHMEEQESFARLLQEKTRSVDEIAQLEQACVIHIPTRMPKNKTKDLTTQEWNYPQNGTEKSKYQVFLDLWEKGCYITPGSKFGGDFLAYPGDPIKFHSFYVVIVVPWTKKIGMLELIGIGRLAATVKKTAVLGTVSDNGEVVYSSVKWSGIS